MKKIILTAFILSIGLSAVSCKKDKTGQAGEAVDANGIAADAVSYAADTTASVINWTGSKQTGSHSGTVKLSNGTVYVAHDTVQGGTFTINMRSITATDLSPEDGKEKLEGHLKGTALEGQDHFFNVTKYPEAKFEITGIKTENGKKTVEGNLTMKGITKNIKFPAIVGVTGNTATIVSDKFVIDRTQWKVNYGSKSVFDDLGDKFVNDEIELKVDVKASK
jgi:polyisoprenoid-binding protein YceI